MLVKDRQESKTSVTQTGTNRTSGCAIETSFSGPSLASLPSGPVSDRTPAGAAYSVRIQNAEAWRSDASKRDGDSDRKKDDGKDEKGKDNDKNSEDDKDKQDDKNSKDNKKGDGKDDGKDKKKSRWPILILVAVVILAIIGVVVYWFMTKDQESTDDAYTEGNAVMMAPKVSGYVVERRVDDNTLAKAGDVMIRIDPRDYITARDQARGNLDLAQAQLLSAQIDLQIARVRAPADLQSARAQLESARASQTNAEREDRRQRAVDPRATTQTNVDQASTQVRSSRATVGQADAQVQIASLVPQNIQSAESTVKQRQAQVEQNAASLAQAELNLSYTELRAPQDGRVTRRNVDVGTYAQAGQQVFYLVSPETWIVANFKETQLDRMRVGQHVRVKVDAYPDLEKIRGHVDSIQAGSGARFTTFPTENATGNYVKIVRRVPVKIVIDSGLDQKKGLPLGLSVEPTVDLR